MHSWAGYLDEREEILALLWQAGGGIIVSGDRNEHATVKFPPPPGSGYPMEHTVIEFSTSPLSFFYQPFVREYVEHAETDVTIYQHPKGSSKFGVFDFDSTGTVWTVQFALVVDGVKRWEYVHKWRPSTVQ
ncbi:hypothetical protein CPB85DRAFT_1345424 [Mucidula mucida]|nr:hypothetical protein CPB85DRAFT_1345424 [Mucidula mucida]